MIYELGIQQNCSEAIIRISLKDQPEEDISALKAKLNTEFEYSDDEVTDWDGQTPKKEFKWYDTHYNDTTIFGTRVLEINGDAPYNNSEEVEKVIKRYLKKAKIEWSE